MAWTAAAGAGDDAAAIGDILQTVIRDADIQTHSPRSSEESGKAVPSAAETGLAFPEPVRAVVRTAGLVLLVLLGLGSLLLIGGLVGPLVRSRGGRPAVPSVEPMADPASPAAGDTPDPDEIERLARGGDFSGAIHLLLLRALGQLERRRDGLLPRSLTSREILRRGPLPGEAGAALAGLVAAVEASHFGGAAADEATYRQCHDGYRRLIAAAPP
jgi:uncharacterized protein DUF4129